MSNGAGPYLMVEGVCKTDKGRVLADVTTGYGDWYVTPDRATQWIPIRYLLMGTMEKGRLSPSLRMDGFTGT